jgi:hypothetical protein
MFAESWFPGPNKMKHRHMTTIPGTKLPPVLLALSLALCGAHAVTLTVTPNNVSADFSGSLTLEIDQGLLAGETVIVE